ncbi:hypothetical protein SPRG_02529 [Saprolegnia parasitica CBS 223.65]|uniref:Thioredoxin domain-containing protein n=1 Tax=Saprolegnia parasitica (strain CBS 223.65) TaxID=695850 RepID=A0A067D264_SAPPC|nr:hypothetical protein SPRG_02529 [Saprolegnia parasitica CBS 223.65]KDO32836.1 hypothetical protein SPRG_02529 [Saprolegnia parasitica CBS 223.65]|eukprot:XP_012196491.1 hypothetical protein SPRG_02529 [Saprolegnia parasitica CBS 223.65]
MTSAFLDLLGPTLLQSGPPRTDVAIDQDAYKAAFEWPHGCDGCEDQIVGKRFGCDQDANFDLCSKCIHEAATLKPECTFTEAPIPDKVAPHSSTAVATAEILAGKKVLLYFSAHWCGPCRGFTPTLATYYTKLQKQLNFEIVFVSSDSDDEAFAEYFGSMPWLALPYAERDRKEALSTKFNVQGIPTLVVLDEEGAVITTNARGKISSDPDGLAFPYVPKTFRQMLGDRFVNRDGAVFGAGDLKGKVLLLYFATAAVEDCDAFTLRLVDAYESAKAHGHELEVLYLSCDESQNVFDDKLSAMPWLAVPFDAAKTAFTDFAELYELETIPQVVVLGVNQGPTRAVINKNARVPWPPMSVVDLHVSTSSNGFSINDKPSLVSYCHTLEGDDLVQHEADMKTLAAECGRGTVCTGDVCTVQDEPSVVFFTVKTAGGLGDRVRDIAGVKDDDVTGPYAILLDVRGGSAYVHDGLNVDALRKTLQQFQDKALDMKALSF